MNGLRVVAVLAIVLGALALVYGGFSYTRESTAAKLGPIELKVEEKKNVNVPVWAGLAGIFAGAIVLVGGGRRK